MANGFQWIFSLVDKVSKPAKDAGNAVGGFEKELKRAQDQLEKIKQHPLEFKKLKDTKKELLGLTRGTKSLSQHFEELKGSIGHIGLVQDLQLGIEGMRMLASAAMSAASAVEKIGSAMVQVAGFEQRSQIAFSSLLGSSGGKEELAWIDKIRTKTTMAQADLRAMESHALRTGMSNGLARRSLLAAMDATALAPDLKKTPRQQSEEIMLAIERVFGSGELQRRSVVSMGLQYEKFIQLFKKENGFNDKSAKEALGSGKYGPQMMHTLLQLMANKEGGALGNLSLKSSKTIDAQFTHLGELPTIMFEKWANSPGFAVFSKAVGKIVDKLDPDGPNGQKIFASLEKASDQVAALVSQFADGNGIDEFVSDIADIPPELKKMRDFLKESWPWVKRITEAWLVFKSVNAVSSAAKTTKGAFGAVAKVAGIGGKGLGLAEKGATAALGVTGATVAVGAAAAASLLYAGYKTNEAVKELGGYKATFRDFKDWWRGDAPAIASQSTRVQASGATKPPVTHFHGDMNLTVNATGSNADEIASAVSQSLPGAVQQSLERMAVSSGAM